MAQAEELQRFTQEYMVKASSEKQKVTFDNQPMRTAFYRYGGLAAVFDNEVASGAQRKWTKRQMSRLS